MCVTYITAKYTKMGDEKDEFTTNPIVFKINTQRWK